MIIKSLYEMIDEDAQSQKNLVKEHQELIRDVYAYCVDWAKRGKNRSIYTALGTMSGVYIRLALGAGDGVEDIESLSYRLGGFEEIHKTARLSNTWTGPFGVRLCFEDRCGKDILALVVIPEKDSTCEIVTEGQDTTHYKLKCTK